MAGILPLFHRCLNEGWPSMSILYITPLRALNRDVDRRLTELAEAVGLRVDVRHGDTTQAQRAKQTRKPPNLLVTTPETFQLMFSGKNLRAMLSTVQAVVVDEVHDLAARSEVGNSVWGFLASRPSRVGPFSGWGFRRRSAIPMPSLTGFHPARQTAHHHGPAHHGTHG